MGEKLLFDLLSSLSKEIPRKPAVIRYSARKGGKDGFIGLRLTCKAIRLRISSNIKVAAQHLSEVSIGHVQEVLMNQGFRVALGLLLFMVFPLSLIHI